MSENKYYNQINEHFENVFEESGLNSPNELQEKILKRIKQGGDLVVTFPEGSGKTYGAILSMLLKNPESNEGSPRALYIGHDADEIKQLVRLLEDVTRRKELLIEIATDKGKMIQQRNYIFFGADIVMGTPNRVYDLYIQNGINLNELNLLIIDDIDEMMTDKLIGDFIRISESLPKCQRIVLMKETNHRVDKILPYLVQYPMKISHSF